MRIINKTRVVVMCVLASMAVPSAQAEHSKIRLDMGHEKRQALEEMIGLLDTSAVLNHSGYNKKSDEEIIKNGA